MWQTLEMGITLCETQSCTVEMTTLESGFYLSWKYNIGLLMSHQKSYQATKARAIRNSLKGS